MHYIRLLNELKAPGLGSLDAALGNCSSRGRPAPVLHPQALLTSTNSRARTCSRAKAQCWMPAHTQHIIQTFTGECNVGLSIAAISTTLLCFKKKNQHAAGKPSVQLAAPIMFHESQLVYWIFIHFGLTIFSISEQLQFS